MHGRRTWLMVALVASACSAGSGSDQVDGGEDDGFGDTGGSGSGTGTGPGSGSGSGSGSMTDGCATGANCVITRIDGAEVSRQPVWFQDPFTRYVPGDDFLEITYKDGG